MKTLIIILTVLSVLGTFTWLFTRKNLLTYFQGGQLWLTWLAVAVICMMDELTSIFYAPSEAYRFIGLQAAAFIAITSVLMRFLSTRYIEIAQILEHHGIKGGGVYSFSYLVLGPTWSFVAIASILVTYILTAAISAVSAVENGMYFLHMSMGVKIGLVLVIIWGIALLNILGIRQNARFTFGVYFLVALVLLTLLTTALAATPLAQWQLIGHTFADSARETFTKGPWTGFSFVTIGVASCILAYSGIESVIQTAGLVRTWQDIRKAYNFRAITIGIFTPLVAALVLTSGIDLKAHEADLITHFASTLNGPVFGVMVGLVACVALIMAVNTAYIATSELFERMAERYALNWLMVTNRHDSLWRMHILNAILYSVVVLVASGSQAVLAEMYALGLVASFTINFGSLLIYRFKEGTREIRAYHTSRLGTLALFLMLVACLVFLAFTRTWGLGLWAMVTLMAVVIGWWVTRTKAPEAKSESQADSPLMLIFAMGSLPGEKVHLILRNPREKRDRGRTPGENEVWVTFYHPRSGAPDKLNDNHFRLIVHAAGLITSLHELLYLLEYELPEKEVTLHFGWPMSSWIDRLSTAALVFNLMRLPRKFPKFNFAVEYFTRKKWARDENGKGIPP